MNEFGQPSGWDFGPGNYSDVTGPATSAADLFGSIGGLVGSVAKAYTGIQSQALSFDMQQSQIDVQKSYADAASTIAKLQAQAAVNSARNQVAYGYPNFDQSMSNLGTLIGGIGGSNNLMLWLTIAGVAIAFVQLTKKRG